MDYLKSTVNSYWSRFAKKQKIAGPLHENGFWRGFAAAVDLLWPLLDQSKVTELITEMSKEEK